MSEPGIEMQRARHALDRIDEVRALTAERKHKAAKYGSYVKALPATIVQIGLGQAMATLLAKAKGDQDDGNAVLFSHLEGWLCTGAAHSPYFAAQAQSASDLMRSIIQGGEDAYIRAQVEAMAYLNWLKKFATAQLKDEGNP